MDKLTGLLQEIRPEFEFTESQDFIADGMFDSLDMVTLVSSLDRAYGISIAGIEIVPENFRSLEAIRNLLTRHGAQT